MSAPRMILKQPTSWFAANSHNSSCTVCSRLNATVWRTCFIRKSWEGTTLFRLIWRTAFRGHNIVSGCWV
jgi:hypothetical protein